MDMCSILGKNLVPEFEELLGRIFFPQLESVLEREILISDGKKIPVVGHIPRFVSDDNYASSFSFQWSTFPETLVDSANKQNLSERELFNKTGLSPEQVAGKLVLDVGVGVGRHAEILARWDAFVVGIDLSNSVEIAYENTRHLPNVAVIQADLEALPFSTGSFDIVISIGVLHHTPDTKASLFSISPMVRPGGLLTIWVYNQAHSRRKEWIPFTSCISKDIFLDWCRWIVAVARPPRTPLLETVRGQLNFSIHHPSEEKCVLQLFDGYTPRYHGVHDSNEVRGWFEELGYIDIVSNSVPTSIKGKKPESA